MLDIIFRCDKDKKIEYVWFDTGLEYKATKEHLIYLENKYNIKIRRERAKLSIPICCKKYGSPFLSKLVSEFIERLQRHNFKWEDEPFHVLYKKYPKCKSALEWWCNKKGNGSSFNISRNKWLKEFLIAYPPKHKISNKCCKKAKKDVINEILKSNNYDLSIQGVRKAEGGIRGSAYKGCFSTKKTKKIHIEEYRPLFWYKNSSKSEYEIQCGIVHSNCYSKYGLLRTGCAGCVFGKNYEFELQIMEKFEPNLYKAALNIFKDSYEYMGKYKEFCNKMDAIYGSYANYLRNKK